MLGIGSRISVGAGTGAVGCFLTTGGDPEYLVTSGHIFAGRVRQVLADEVRVGVLEHNLLESHDGADAALVRLTQSGVRLAEEGTRLRSHPKALANASLVYATAGRTYLPTRRRYTKFYRTQRGPEEVIMEVPARPRYPLYSPIVIATECTQPGDSGSLLMNKKGYALGLVAGEFGGQSVFQPLPPVIDIFREIVPHLSLWSPE